MGLAAAFQALRDGHQVRVLEASPIPGGMSAHFNLGSLSIERFYHFVCRNDADTIQLLDELGLKDKLHWKPTSMGFFYKGKLNRWGDPIALLSVANTPLSVKLRYGFFIWVCSRKKSWPELEGTPAHEWLIRWCGQQGYQEFWHSLLDYKFYEYADRISAHWIWTRIKRVGSSRRSVFQEVLGYIEGGSETLVNGLVQAIEQAGGRIHLRCAAERITTENGAVTGVMTPGGHLPADAVISTIPTPLVTALAPDLPAAWLEKYQAIHNLGVSCVIFKLKRSISPHFWINISDMNHEIPGVIEFSNLRDVGATVVYVPYYMPVTNRKFSWTDAQFIDDALDCLRQLNGEISSDDVIESHVSRLAHAQPLCDVNFAAKLPPIQTPIAGLQIADTCFYYPEDRSISESVRVGRAMARGVNA